MICTDEQREEIRRQLADSWWVSMITTSDQRDAILRVTERELQKSLDSGGMQNEYDYYMWKDAIVKRVREDVEIKGFLSIILMAALGWIVTKILDALWDNWKTNNQVGNE